MAQSTPLPFLLIQKTFPILEKIAPRLAGKFGKFLFFRPFPIPSQERGKSDSRKGGTIPA